MKIYIDANVFLDFYDYTSEDLEELRKLAVLAENDVTLLLPEQTIDEFNRNREKVISNALKGLEGQKLNQPFPAVCKEYDEQSEMMTMQREYAAKHTELMSKVRGSACSKALKADVVIEELFGQAEIIPTTDTLIERAERRHKLGNPPGKGNLLGDEVNWEAVIAATSVGDEVCIITDDGDYYSELDRNTPKAVLAKEWADCRGTEAKFYRRISQYFEEHYPDINFASDIEKQRVVRALVSSGTFGNTHQTISKLSQFENFSAAEVNAMVEAALDNSQINWILTDADVNEFFAKLVNDYEQSIQVDRAAMLLVELAPTPPAPANDDFDDIPF